VEDCSYPNIALAVKVKHGSFLSGIG